MKKALLALVALCSGGSLFATLARVYNGTSRPMEIEIKWVAESAIGCRPNKYTLKPGATKTKRKGCNPRYLKYRFKGEKKWKKTKEKGSETVRIFAIQELKDGSLRVKAKSTDRSAKGVFETEVNNYVYKKKGFPGERPDDHGFSREEIEEYFNLPPKK